MDLQKLEADLQVLEQRFREFNGAFWQKVDETARKINHDGYTAEDYERELEAFSQQQHTIYSPRDAIHPLLDDVVAAYVLVSAEDRAAIRHLCWKFSCASFGLLDYILECAASLKTSADENIFRSGIIAASIQDCASDFRDTSATLAELAMAAVKAGVNMESHCTEIAELSSAEQSRGGWQTSMKEYLAGFHIYAQKAKQLF